MNAAINRRFAADRYSTLAPVEDLVRQSEVGETKSDREARRRLRVVCMVYDLIPILFPAWIPANRDVYLAHFLSLIDTADEYVRDNPWQAIGAVALIGVTVGFLLARRS